MDLYLYRRTRFLHSGNLVWPERRGGVLLSYSAFYGEWRRKESAEVQYPPPLQPLQRPPHSWKNLRTLDESSLKRDVGFHKWTAAHIHSALSRWTWKRWWWRPWWPRALELPHLGRGLNSRCCYGQTEALTVCLPTFSSLWLGMASRKHQSYPKLAHPCTQPERHAAVSRLRQVKAAWQVLVRVLVSTGEESAERVVGCPEIIWRRNGFDTGGEHSHHQLCCTRSPFFKPPLGVWSLFPGRTHQDSPFLLEEDVSWNLHQC